MRVMVLIKANEDSEAGVMPDEQFLTEMNNYNEELVKAGVMLAGEGLHPSSKGARVLFSGEKRTVVDGPFTEAKELIAGFWLWQVRSMDEAIEWVKRMPNPTGVDAEVRDPSRSAKRRTSGTPYAGARAQDERIRAEAERNRAEAAKKA